MNILLIGPLWGNAKHGAEPGVYDALVELGHNVAVWDFRTKRFRNLNGVDLDNIDPNNPPTNIATPYDMVLSLGAGLTENIINTTLWNCIKCCAVRVLWNSEPIRLGNYRGRIELNQKEFTTFCTFDESEVPIYAELGIQAHFLPQGFNPKWYHPLQLPPSQRFPGHVCFIGSVGGKWENRTHLLNRVQQLGFKIHVASIFDAAKVNHAYNMHDAVLNLGLYCPQSGPAEDLKAFGLQQRVFECIGAGRVCVTNEIPGGTNKLLVHNENVLFYNRDNLEDVLHLVIDKRHRKRIEAGVMRIREQHTYEARMKRLLSIVQPLIGG